MASREPDDFLNVDNVDLRGVDLSQVHLDEPRAPRAPPSRGWALLFLVLALAGLGLLRLTDFWRRQGNDSALAFGVALVSIVLGLMLGRLLWQWGIEAAERAEYRSQEPKEEKPPSALRRWGTLGLVAAGAIAIVMGANSSSYYRGDSSWFLAAAGALVIGILGGRWLLMQAAARNAAETQQAEPYRLPPYFRWVTLGVLVALGVGTAIAAFVMGPGRDPDVQAVLGGLGFIVGIGGAIWIARRFDEVERKASKRATRGD